MKFISIALMAFTVSSCSTVVVTECPGNVDLPLALTGEFDVVEDAALLESALAGPTEGKLCQGKVYQAKQSVDVTLYRAWNSTNPGSRFDNWWAFHRPDGNVAQYRHNYEICYQWSPLDKLTHCKLNAGSKIVVGTGQSAECSKYLTYPTSTSLQVYIEDAASSLYECIDYDVVFSWAPVVN